MTTPSTSEVRGAVVDTVARLRTAGLRPEVLGVHRPQARRLGIGRRERILPEGEAWRLGVLLLRPSGELARVAEVVIAQEERRRGFPAESARRRAELGEAAVRGGIEAGRAVHVGWRPLDPQENGGLVTWSETLPPAPLLTYLSERADLALAAASAG